MRPVHELSLVAVSASVSADRDPGIDGSGLGIQSTRVLTSLLKNCSNYINAVDGSTDVVPRQIFSTFPKELQAESKLVHLPEMQECCNQQ